jgi:lipid A ethanolaminephosphotransferase
MHFRKSAYLNDFITILREWKPHISTTTLSLVTSLFASVACNGNLWSKLYVLSATANWGFLLAMFVLVSALQFIIFTLLINRWTAKPLLAIICLLTGATVYFMHRFGVYMDAAMIRNVAETDPREVRDLLAWDMFPYFGFYVALPWLLLWRIRIKKPPLQKSWYIRPLTIIIALLVSASAFYPISKQLIPLMREQKTLRYLITPSNYIYSLLRVFVLKEQGLRPREVIGMDAIRTPRLSGEKPRLLVIMVGETHRAANWGLNGYSRLTTPKLATEEVINFRQATSCGTNTATSVPCMFSVYGRRHYDEDRIRGSESLLNVLQHAGIQALWMDNQSGCKGVCKGVDEIVMKEADDPSQCRHGECLDGVLLAGLDTALGTNSGDRILVLHMMGLHGPAYFQRYPNEYRRFTPTCDTTQLETCTHAQIVNTYDNAMLYSDHVIASVIDRLKSVSARYETALLFASDHGESLGENGLYLHSIPYAIAPDEQTHIPMILWLSPEFRTSTKLKMDCLRRRADQPASHDNLFHTVIGLMGVSTTLYDPSMDLTTGCHF